MDTAATKAPPGHPAATRVDHRMLNDAQRLAVTHRDGPLLVLAGPGSGKTRVLIHRIAAIAETGGRPDRIAAVTFTNKAALELRERLAVVIGKAAAAEVHASTFHAFCLQLLRRYHDEVALPRWFSVLDAGDAEKLLRLELVALGGDPGDTRAFAAQISYAKNTGSPREHLAGTVQGALLTDLLDAYTARCQELGVVDFDDLLCHARTVLQGPSGPSIAARFDSLVVDEWQDTNQVQYDIVAALAGADRTRSDVCVVGDPMQSIYSWRGSSSEVTERFVADFAPTVIELGENYRSTAKIVAVTDAVAAAAVKTRRARLHTANPAGDDVEVWRCADPDAEAKRVVAALSARVVGRKNSDGTRVTGAVLVRTNAQTRVFENTLDLAGIAHQLVGTVRFTDRAEVKDALAYLRTVVNPTDRLSFARAANTPRRKLGDVSLQSFFDACAAVNIAPGVAVADPEFRATLRPALARALAVFADGLDLVGRAAATGSVAATVRAVLDCGLRDHHAAEPERVANLDELLAAATGFDRDVTGLAGIARVEEFAQRMSLSSATDGAEPYQVSVITAHASKGREFDHVFVVGAEDGIIPHSLARTAAEYEEERRLFFVAVSRARTRLVVSTRDRNFVNGEWRNARRSPFIDDIEHLCVSDRPAPPARRYPSPRVNAPAGFAYPATTPAAVPTGPRLAAADVAPGVVVVHSVFGTGTVVEVIGSIAAITFAGKVRSLDLEFAPLTAG